ncbi:hypothetical protein EXIGLDRAFT_716114 [Exidia glandulosa HHB12029]|uniref:Anaphase-promoting complex subunit 2 n=1 Tax=Exidia glandulosa HHB12029 TaxID=1314781 RepID=A0A165QV00_EXIGL|nr:hypothetical protein EXIGLDRAFT_716114 [Exidia glandulosa HHB12029]
MDVDASSPRRPTAPRGLGFAEVHTLVDDDSTREPARTPVGFTVTSERFTHCPPAFKHAVQESWRDAVQQLNGGRQPVTILNAFGKAWEIATAYLTPKDIALPQQDIAVVKAAVDYVAAAQMGPALLKFYDESLSRQIPFLEREIDAYMAAWESSRDVATVRKLVARLFEWGRAWAPAVELGGAFDGIFYTTFKSNLHIALPPSFPEAFVYLVQSTIGDLSDTDLFKELHMLGMLDRYEALVASVVCEQIERQIETLCPGKWDEPRLPELRHWLGDKVVAWLMEQYSRAGTSASNSIPGHNVIVQEAADRFDFHICKTMCDLRTSEIFDMIVDYPDSMPALLDLKECMQRVDQRAHLVTTLRRLNKRRLLHPGADTKDILSQYVSTIKCLRVIDPPGVLLFKVADPIRRYLRERPDTIRTIVAGLVGEGSDLIDETEANAPMQTAVEDYSDPNWEPEPIDAGPDFRTNKPSDVISTLVSIYDSKDLFVKELQVLLAERLLAITDGNYERELRNIEILKLRFGESALQVCEIMLKDMTDSKRLDQRIHSTNPSVLHSTVISKHFWPALNARGIKMPGQLQEILKAYERSYILQRPDKRLHWIPHLGTVKLEIQLKDRRHEVDAAPMEAAIIELFSQKETWTLDELATSLGSEAAVVRKALSKWLDMRVVREDSPHAYRLLEEAEEDDGQTGLREATPIAEDERPAVISLQQQQAEQMRVFWRFIQGMLTNVGPMSTERIQGMLKLAPGYDRTVEQLAIFLDSARREGLVDAKDGVWKIVK